MKIEDYFVPLCWFLSTNVAVCLLFYLNLSLLGLAEVLSSRGVGLAEIWFAILFCSSLSAAGLILGSKMVIRYYLGARIVDDTADTKLLQLRLIVIQQAKSAGIMVPTLAVYHSHDMNAFAVGSGRQNAILVISQSLLDALTLDELSAVIGHEITHITNGDMLTLSLMQGVVNLCVHFPARLFGMGLDKLFFMCCRVRPAVRTISLLLQICLGGMASLIVMWFSRQREFRADAGGAKLAGYPEMLAALRCLQAGSQTEPVVRPFAVFGLNGKLSDSRFWRLFTSHPSLAERIKVLTQTG